MNNLGAIADIFFEMLNLSRKKEAYWLQFHCGGSAMLCSSGNYGGDRTVRMVCKLGVGNRGGMLLAVGIEGNSYV